MTKGKAYINEKGTNEDATGNVTKVQTVNNENAPAVFKNVNIKRSNNRLKN